MDSLGRGCCRHGCTEERPEERLCVSVGSYHLHVLFLPYQRIRQPSAADQRTSEPADQRIIGSSDHRSSGSSDQMAQRSGSADQRISGSDTPAIMSHLREPLRPSQPSQPSLQEFCGHSGRSCAGSRQHIAPFFHLVCVGGYKRKNIGGGRPRHGRPICQEQPRIRGIRPPHNARASGAMTCVCAGGSVVPGKAGAAASHAPAFGPTASGDIAPLGDAGAKRSRRQPTPPAQRGQHTRVPSPHRARGGKQGGEPVANQRLVLRGTPATSAIVRLRVGRRLRTRHSAALELGCPRATLRSGPLLHP